MGVIFSWYNLCPFFKKRKKEKDTYIYNESCYVNDDGLWCWASHKFVPIWPERMEVFCCHVEHLNIAFTPACKRCFAISIIVICNLFLKAHNHKPNPNPNTITNPNPHPTLSTKHKLRIRQDTQPCDWQCCPACWQRKKMSVFLSKKNQFVSFFFCTWMIPKHEKGSMCERNKWTEWYEVVKAMSNGNTVERIPPSRKTRSPNFLPPTTTEPLRDKSKPPVQIIMRIHKLIHLQNDLNDDRLN